MPTSISVSSVTRGGRGRSRYGCRNCKLRKLKCDELKPQCKRCTSFGVICNFIPGIADLEPSATALKRQRVSRVKAHPRPPVSSAVWTCDETTSYQLNSKCQHFITQYLGRSLTTTVPGDPNMRLVNSRLLGLAFTHPYLMHASLAVAYSYERHLNASAANRQSMEECYHWSQATMLFNTRLKKPIEAEERDPIWGTAAALAILGFSSPAAITPAEAWPMATSEPSDLDWLSLNKGKMALWHKVNPLRADSIFSVMGATFGQLFSPLPESGREGIPDGLADLCGLYESSSSSDNPYFHASHAVSRILHLPDKEVTTGLSQIFMRCIQGHFETLLWLRDPIALLLLYLWYGKARRSIWWIDLRARVEMPSIALYLRLHHGHLTAVQTALSEEPAP